MADLSKIKVGDKLRLEVTVTGIDDSEMPIDVIVGDDEDFWPHTWIEAAEHIPAPREFKRGDFVRQISGRGYQEPYRRGIVLIPAGVRAMMPSFVNVHWPHGEMSNEDPRNLEPDEAPE